MYQCPVRQGGVFYRRISLSAKLATNDDARPPTAFPGTGFPPHSDIFCYPLAVVVLEWADLGSLQAALGARAFDRPAAPPLHLSASRWPQQAISVELLQWDMKVGKVVGVVGERLDGRRGVQ